ncbi:MAG: U32 family peptidase [Selenomonadaceae bacterium]|nr:U32 family peptidase [Selenomonadaceae bacterium]
MIELLAPAGNFDALKAAVHAGANAVYLAGSSFGARAYADNFNRENLASAVKFAHLHGVAIHVTTNTILNDSELETFADYIKFLREVNVDAFIVQDLGAAEIIRTVAPEIPMHASTQMTVHNLAGVQALAELGFSRVVLARELTLDEISHIAKNSPLETEIFAHGALCVCFSGQCLMSSMIGGRSGNRGRCAQPCRLPYTLVDAAGNEILKTAGEYLLSPKDLNTLDLLPRFVEAGVTSLKIEGRMKRAEYVATVVKVYRDALDKNSADAESHRRLAQIFNRDFTTAYLEKNPGRDLISDTRPNNRGVLIGRVTAVGKNKITLKTAGEIHAGDQIEIWVKVGGRVTFTVENFSTDGDFCTVEVADMRGVRVHDRAFKIFDAELTAEARKFFTDDTFGKIPVDATVRAEAGAPLTLTVTDGKNSATAATNFIAEPAKNRPLNLETLSKQIGRLGTSEFVLRNLTAEISGEVMVPVSELNEVRRAAIAELENLRLAAFKKNPAATAKKIPAAPYRAKNIELVAQVDTLEKIKAALDGGADSILYGGENFTNRIVTAKEIAQAADTVKARGKNFYLATPRIVREAEIPALEKILAAAEFDAVYVHGVGTLRIVKSLTGAPVRTDFSLPVFNSTTIDLLAWLGGEAVTLSPELTLAQVNALAEISPLPVECIVHGRIELMISAYCAIGSFLGDVNNCQHFCRKNNYCLRDRKNIEFPVVTDQFCRMHILNSKTLSMIERRADFENVARLRVDCRYLSAEEITRAVSAYKSGGLEIENFTRGHYFRGVE